MFPDSEVGVMSPEFGGRNDVPGFESWSDVPGLFGGCMVWGSCVSLSWKSSPKELAEVGGFRTDFAMS